MTGPPIPPPAPGSAVTVAGAPSGPPVAPAPAGSAAPLAPAGSTAAPRAAGSAAAGQPAEHRDAGDAGGAAFVPDAAVGPAEGPVPPAAADVVVVGAGVIGLACAWRLARQGLAVAVFDPSPGRGSSWVAAGMLAPVTELHHGEEPLLALTLASARRWPGFAAELAGATGRHVGYDDSGTLLVAGDADDRRWAQELHRYQVDLGLAVEWLTPRRARQLEPSLAPGIAGALWAPGDHQVDNRRLLAALGAAVGSAGAGLFTERVAAVETAGGRVTGVRTAAGHTVAAPRVVLAAGWGSASLQGLPEGLVPPVRPVKGQILRLRHRDGSPRLLGRTVRALVQGSVVYLVPRADGEVVLGATMEEMGDDTTPTAGAAYQLLRDATRILPGVSELAVAELAAGLRPGSPDNAPVVGAVPAGSGADGLVIATGHHRNGVLLAPLTADAVAALVTGGPEPPETAPFGPARFAAMPRPSRA